MFSLKRSRLKTLLLSFCVVQFLAAAIAAAGHNLSTRQHIKRLEGCAGSRVGFSPDGQLIITAGEHSVRVWDYHSFTPKTERIEFGADIWFANLSANGKLVFIDGENESQLWDVATSKRRQGPFRHRKAEFPAAITPNGLLVATPADRDKEAWIWNTATGKVLASLHHQNRVVEVAFGSDELLLTMEWGGDSSKGMIAHLWNPRAAREPLFTIATDFIPSALPPFAFTNDGKRLALPVNMKSVAIWDVTTGKQVSDNSSFDTSGTSTALLRAISFSSDGQEFVTVTSSFVRVWNAQRGRPLGPRIEVIPTNVGFGKHGLIVLGGGEDGLGVWDYASGLRVQRFSNDFISVVAMHPFDDIVALGSERSAGTDNSFTDLWRIAMPVRGK